MTYPVDSALAALPQRLVREDSKRTPLQQSWAAVGVQRQLVLVLLLAVAVTVASRVFPLTLKSRTGDAIVETVASLISALAAFVFLERRRSARHQRDLLIALSLGILSATNLLLAAAPTLIGADRLPNYLQVIVVLLAGSAAIGLVRSSARTGDGLERSLAAGATVLGIAYFDYLLEPSLGSDRLYAGDMLKLGAFLLVLYGCVLEFRTLQRELARQVAVDERRRMARDMHDGLAQELAFIASHSQRLSHTGEDAATAAHLRSAAERALHDSRTTIAVLTAPEDVPLDLLVVRTVDSFRSRFGVDVELDLEQGVVVGAESRNALLRILHEGLINAVRHGSAQRILVSLNGNSHGQTLRIADDGCGFDVQAAISTGSGLGLTSMQERAGLLGGTLRIASTPGAGTVVEVGLP